MVNEKSSQNIYKQNEKEDIAVIEFRIFKSATYMVMLNAYAVFIEVSNNNVTKKQDFSLACII